MNEPHNLDRSDAINQWWPRGGPYSTEQAATAAATIAQLTGYLAKAVQLDSSLVLAYPVDAKNIVDGLRPAIDDLGKVLGQLYERAIGLADDPALRHDRGKTRAASTATEAGAALFAAMTSLPAVLLNLTRAAERLSHLRLDRVIGEGR